MVTDACFTVVVVLMRTDGPTMWYSSYKYGKENRMKYEVGYPGHEVEVSVAPSPE